MAALWCGAVTRNVVRVILDKGWELCNITISLTWTHVVTLFCVVVFWPFCSETTTVCFLSVLLMPRLFALFSIYMFLLGLKKLYVHLICI